MMKTNTLYRSSERGAMLIAVLMLVLVLGGLSASALSSNLGEYKAIEHRETALQALEAAEAGLVRAEMEILAMKDLGDDGIGVVKGSITGGTYEVIAVQDPDFPQRWELRARGENGLSVRRIAVGLRRRQSGYWAEGIFANGDFVNNGGISTDSYDSRLGDWESQAVNTDSGGMFAGRAGSIGANGLIGLQGTSLSIRGNAIPGPGHEVKMAGQPNVGDTVSRTDEIPFEAPAYDDFVAAYKSADNRNMLVRIDDGDGISGEDDELSAPDNWTKIGYSASSYALAPKAQTTVVLPGGTYFFTDLSLGGGATLEVLGPCVVYVTGNLDLTGGGLVNGTGVPANFQVFAHPYVIPAGHNPAKASVTVEGGGQVAAAIYAPYRDMVVTGTGALFGSVVGQNITVNGDAYLHYDEALGMYHGTTEPFIERLYWRELGPLTR